MRIAVASGKGGTGKTTVATSLALSLNAATTAVLDCDVEAPNAHLFLTPIFEWREAVSILIPRVDESQCTVCGHCAEVCQFHAIAHNCAGEEPPVVDPIACDGCAACVYQCPTQAIHMQPQAARVDAGLGRSGNERGCQMKLLSRLLLGGQ
jgi:MinD superfamily P-loop ATPase